MIPNLGLQIYATDVLNGEHREHLTDAVIEAVKMRRTCGRYAASRFVTNHGIPRKLYRIALQLHAVREFDA